MKKQSIADHSEKILPFSLSPKRALAKHLSLIGKSGIRDFFEIVQNQQDVISLGIGEPDFDTPWMIREASIFALEKGETGYTSNLGLIELRKLISQYVAKLIGVEYDPYEEIIVTVGVSEALDCALRAILDPQDEVIIHQPSYVSYVPLVILAHGIPVLVETQEKDGFRLDPLELEKKITKRTKALILNFPTNPTGSIQGEKELEALAEIVKKHNLFVVTDEIYAELTYEGKHRSIAAFEGMKERTLFVHGLSKAFSMTGYRIGYGCGPKEWIEAMLKIHQYSILCASSVAQYAAIEALSKGKKAMEKMVEEYRLRRNFLWKNLSALGLAGCFPQGAFYYFPSIKAYGLSSRDFSYRLLQEGKVAIVPGSAFGQGGEGYVRCSFAARFEELEEAVRRIEKWLKKIEKEAKK
ncbi:aminotransferase class I/II-fold pyridoxal phosphate-dependent enzyme [Candidatus Methylacidiphilum infernorum]|uniref:Aminotransferase n=1 Tax=Methylacidiphilum infernorum (isolate V4) TaxID=481448 RepID=B3E062_METI4|nr:aminotransferase class I/II-fold pyridoxal phosphate-dependent enzyme [Candidatus Methylacidiphilum infernorum]ACD82723.1 Aspartate/aromatic aminotransferase [Methylacidiphilum infernorum V4]